MNNSRNSMTGGGLGSIILMIIATIILVFLLWRTEHNAVEIRETAAGIATNGRGINEYTDSIMQLNKTNELASSILESAEPLDGALSTINSVAGDIDGAVASIQKNATSIDTSAASINKSGKTIRADAEEINSVADDIDDTAGGILKNAKDILKTAQAIERGTNAINTNAATTASLVGKILADAKGINTAAGTTNQVAACIDDTVNLGALGVPPCP